MRADRVQIITDMLSSIHPRFPWQDRWSDRQNSGIKKHDRKLFQIAKIAGFII